MCTDILLCIPWVLCYYSPHTPPHSQVLNDGNEDKIDKVVVLRMNREFMKFGRQYYAYRLTEPFGKFGTVLTVESNVEMGAVDIASDLRGD